MLCLYTSTNTINRLSRYSSWAPPHGVHAYCGLSAVWGWAKENGKEMGFRGKPSGAP